MADSSSPSPFTCPYEFYSWTRENYIFVMGLPNRISGGIANQDKNGDDTLIQKVKKTAALATLTVFGTVTLAQAADTWAVEGYEILEAQTATTALSHSDEVTWSAFDTTFLALSHADQIIWHEEEKKKLATFSHGDVITWDCPKPAQVAAIN